MPEDPRLTLTKDADVDEVLAAVEALFDELITSQQNRVNRYARSLIPNLTDEDILQPHDYPALDRDPRFQYEDGQVTAMRSMLLSFRARIVRALREPKG